MRHLTMRILVSAVLPALFLFSCGDDGNPSDSGTASPYATACQSIVSSSYTLSFPAADSAVATNPAHSDTNFSCINNSLVSTPTTVAAVTQRFHYRLASSSYLLWMEGVLEAALKLAIGLNSGGLLNVDSVDLYLVYQRSGGGSGVDGLWAPDSVTYTARRNLNIIEKALLDSIMKVQTQTIRSDKGDPFEIHGNTLTTFTAWSAADQFLATWAADSAGHAIVATRLNDCEMSLTGTLSGETVTISGDSKGATVFRSTSAAFPEHIYYPSNPRACPNTQKPSWWQTFLDNNERP